LAQSLIEDSGICRTLHEATPLQQLAGPDGPGALASANVIEVTHDGPECFQAKLARFEARSQKLQFENVELRLRLKRRKSQWAFERKLLIIAGLGLLLVGLLLGLFLGLVVGNR
jgi:hypothetical protein